MNLCEICIENPILFVPQGFSFLWRYVDLRGHCQESLYNLGRALHQLGLSHLAIHYYEKALTLPPLKLEVRRFQFNICVIHYTCINHHRNIPDCQNIVNKTHIQRLYAVNMYIYLCINRLFKMLCEMQMISLVISRGLMMIKWI